MSHNEWFSLTHSSLALGIMMMAHVCNHRTLTHVGPPHGPSKECSALWKLKQTLSASSLEAEILILIPDGYRSLN